MSDGFFGRLLVGTDGSVDALDAVEIAVELAKRCESRVWLIHTAGIPSYPPELAPPPDQYDKFLADAGNAVIAASGRVLRDAGVDFESAVLRRSPPADAIMHFADEHEIDAIILGRRGLGAVGRLLLGSVSHRVVNEADQTVILAPKRRDPSS